MLNQIAKMITKDFFPLLRLRAPMYGHLAMLAANESSTTRTSTL
jgi:hypothetical protein